MPRALCLALLAGCRPIDGPWSGHCDWAGPKGAERAADLSVDLRPPDDDGIGKGSARVTEDDGRQGADVVYLSAGDELSIDLYLEDGDELFLRGTLDGGVASGACGSPVVEQFSFDELVDCVSGLDLECDTSPEWSAKKGEPAPIVARDLDGHFRLARD